jgi:hypothetical protein
MVHTRFFSNDSDAVAAYEEIKPALVEILSRLPERRADCLHDVPLDDLHVESRRVPRARAIGERLIDHDRSILAQPKRDSDIACRPTQMREKIATVTEPQNASYVVVTLKDGRSAKSSGTVNRAAICRRKSVMSSRVHSLI